MSVSDAEKAEVAANVLNAFLGEPVQQVVEAPEVEETPASSPEVVNDTAETDEVEAPSFEFSPEIPEDVLREIEEADIDDAVERELAARQPAVADDEYEYHEPVAESEDEIRERLKLKKRNEYLEAELAKTKRGSWKQEAIKYFPLAEHSLDEIDATSRRAFLRAAKAEHERILPHVQKVLSDAKAFATVEREQAKQEGKAAARAAFGEPLSGPDVASIDMAAANSELEAARAKAKETGSLAGLFKVMFNQGK